MANAVRTMSQAKLRRLVTRMKKLLLSGIAALFLATGTPHARDILDWQCGKKLVNLDRVKVLKEDGTYAVSYVIMLPLIERNNHIAKVDPLMNAFRYDIENGIAWLNGKRCKPAS